MKTIIKVFFLAIFLSLLTSCAATPHKQFTNEGVESTDAFDDFINKKLRLCGTLSCAGHSGSAHKETMRIYHQELWDELINLIINYGDHEELDYFLLARAAEGLKYYDTARFYYKYSKTVGRKCKDVFALCDGLNLPELTNQRLAALPHQKSAPLTHASVENGRQDPSKVKFAAEKVAADEMNCSGEANKVTEEKFVVLCDDGTYVNMLCKGEQCSIELKKTSIVSNSNNAISQTPTQHKKPNLSYTWSSPELKNSGYDSNFSLIQYNDKCLLETNVTKISSLRNVKLFKIDFEITSSLHNTGIEDVVVKLDTMQIGESAHLITPIENLLSIDGVLKKCPNIVSVELTIPKEKFEITEHSSVQLKRDLDNLIGGKDIKWCKDAYISRLYSPRKYQILGNIDEDIFSEESGYWLNVYNVRIESSNKGGRPVIKDWSFYMLNQGDGWCLTSFS